MSIRSTLSSSRVNEPALGIELQGRGHAHHLVAEVLMQQMNRAHADAEEQDRLAQLEQPDQQQAAIVVLVLS